MRFTAIFATLASAMFAAAIPAPAPAADALAERNVELKRQQPANLDAVLTKLHNDVKPHCDALDVVVDIDVDIVKGHLLDIEAVIKVAIADIKLLVDIETEIGIFGPKGYVSIITLLANIVILVISVVAKLVALLTVVTRPLLFPLLQAIACLLADLIALVLSLLKGLLAFLLVLVTNLLFGLLVVIVGHLKILEVGDYWKSCGIFLLGL